MIRAVLLSLLVAAPAAAETVLPSGLAATPHDALIETQPGGEAWLVLRYLAPAIAGGAVPYESVVPDLDSLCETEGLAQAESSGLEIAQIVIVLTDRPVTRGVPDPAATQYIGSYAVDGGTCRWE